MPVGSISEGTHKFLECDEIFGSVGLLIWAGWLNFRSWFDLRKLVVLTVGLGPSGAAGWMVWERDERVWAAAAAERNE